MFAGIMAKTLPDFIKKKKKLQPYRTKVLQDSKHKRNAQTHAKTLQGHMTKKRDTTKTTQNWQTDTAGESQRRSGRLLAVKFKSWKIPKENAAKTI